MLVLLVWLLSWYCLGVVGQDYDEITIQIDNSGSPNIPPPGAVGPISPYFASFSAEWLQFVQGSLFNGSNRATDLQLFKNLRDATGATPWLRIGGASTDWTWASVGSTPVWYSRPCPGPGDCSPFVSTTLFQQLNSFFTELGGGAKYVLGLNFFLSNDPSYAVNESLDLIEQLGPSLQFLHALEIGNECDIYASDFTYRNASTWTPSEYDAEWNIYTDAIDAAFNASGLQIKYQGATFCCRTPWFAYLPTFIANNKQRLRSISVHDYAQGPGDLATLVTTGIYPGKAQLDGYANATAAGIEYQMGETGSVSQGGSANVSDVFAGGALWGIDWLFNGVALGYKGMNFQAIGSSAPYSPWNVGTPPDIRPLYYALLAFARTIAGPNAYLLNTNTMQGSNKKISLSFNSTQPQVSVWSTLDLESGVRKVIVNHRNITGNTPDAQVTVSFSTTGGIYPNAILYFLEAPSPYSKTGVTLAGQTFDGSADGTIQGPLTTFTLPMVAINNNNDGNVTDTWQFTMHPSSTAFLTICPADNSIPCGGISSSSASGVRASKFVKWFSSLW